MKLNSNAVKLQNNSTTNYVKKWHNRDIYTHSLQIWSWLNSPQVTHEACVEPKIESTSLDLYLCSLMMLTPVWH